MAALLDVVTSVPPTRVTTWKGSTWDAFLGLMFLHREHPDECITLSRALEIINEIEGDPTANPETQLSWDELALVWMDGELLFPQDSQELFAKAATACKARFVLAMLILVSPNGEYLHANFVMFDSKHHTVERYETYGTTPPLYETQDGSLDLELLAAAREIWGLPVTLAKPVLSEEAVRSATATGIQRLQESEHPRERSRYDPVGYCVAHSTMYAHVRLMNKMLPAMSIPDLILSLNKKYGNRMTMFVRLFSNHLRKLDDEMRKTSGPEQPGVPQDFIRKLLKSHGR